MEVSEIIETNEMLSTYIVNTAQYRHLLGCVMHFFSMSDADIFWKQSTVLLWLNHQQYSLNHPNGPGWACVEWYKITQSWSVGWCVNIIGDLILFEYLIFEVKLRQECDLLQNPEILFSWWLGTNKNEAAKTLMHNNRLQMSVNMFC